MKVFHSLHTWAHVAFTQLLLLLPSCENPGRFQDPEGTLGPCAGSVLFLFFHSSSTLCPFIFLSCWPTSFSSCTIFYHTVVLWFINQFCLWSFILIFDFRNQDTIDTCVYISWLIWVYFWFLIECNLHTRKLAPLVHSSVIYGVVQPSPLIPEHSHYTK